MIIRLAHWVGNAKPPRILRAISFCNLLKIEKLKMESEWKLWQAWMPEGRSKPGRWTSSIDLERVLMFWLIRAHLKNHGVSNLNYLRTNMFIRLKNLNKVLIGFKHGTRTVDKSHRFKRSMIMKLQISRVNNRTWVFMIGHKQNMCSTRICPSRFRLIIRRKSLFRRMVTERTSLNHSNIPSIRKSMS